MPRVIGFETGREGGKEPVSMKHALGGRMGAGGIAAAFGWLSHTTEIPRRDEELFLGMWELYAFTQEFLNRGNKAMWMEELRNDLASSII